ncbi:MAG TPA: molybdopterin molybdenumtransferase MoeA [Firmicutes bacterium]|nr:molybdopterin molybdenumtransferase MoeA [Bacillota bacterium]
MEFLKTQKRKFAIENFIKNLSIISDNQIISIEESSGRIVAKDKTASIDVPSLPRSTVDGYACISGLTSGASHNNPIPFEYGGEIIIGEKYKGEIDKNKVYYIPTGAIVPDGFDAVVMIENSERVNDTVYVEKSLYKGENIIYKGEDVKIGDVIANKGEILRSVDIGILASQGIREIPVHKKVKIAIIPTGKELRRSEDSMDDYSIYDINSYLLKSLFSEFKYFDAKIFEIVKDDEIVLRDMIKENYDDFDVFIVSGGSSKGMRDITVDVIEQFGTPGILTHGINMSPGKPTILSLCNNKIIFGAPGHPVSSYISARFVMIPILNYFAGKKEIFERATGRGIISVDIPSKHGMDDFVRVKVKDGIITPIFGQSGMISTLSDSDGIIIIGNEKEGLYKGEKAEYYEMI